MLHPHAHQPGASPSAGPRSTITRRGAPAPRASSSSLGDVSTGRGPCPRSAGQRWGWRDCELWVLLWRRGTERGHPRVLLVPVGWSRAGPVPWGRGGLGPGVRPLHPSGSGGPGRGCHVGPASGCLRRYIRAGAEAAVARRCHGNLHGDVVGWVPGGEARPPRAPFSRRGPRALPRFEHISLPSCPCPPVPPSPKGEVSSSQPCSCTLGTPHCVWPQHQPGGCLVSMMDISHQCGPQSADGQEPWRVGGCQPTPLLYLMTAWFGGALDQTQCKESMRFVMRPIVGDEGQAYGSGATCGAGCVSKGTLE